MNSRAVQLSKQNSMNPLVRQTKSKTTSGKFQRILSHIHGVVKNEHPKLSHVNKREGLPPNN